VNWRSEQKALRKVTGAANRREYWLSKLVRGFRFRDCIWLSRYEEMLGNIYLITAPRPSPGIAGVFSARCLEESDGVPWPLVLLLGSHSKRFVFSCSTLRWSTVHRQLADFENRVKWLFKFWGSSARAEHARPLGSRKVAHCGDVLPPELAAVVAGVKRRTIEACKKVVNKKSYHPVFVDYSLKWLAKNKIEVQLADKDGVFVLVARDALRSMTSEQFLKPYYRPLRLANLTALHRIVTHDLHRLAELVKPISIRWSQEIHSSARGTEADLLCGCLATVKTHKCPVTTRLIHNASRCLLNPVCAAVHRIVDAKLRSVSHLVQSSEEAAARLASFRIGPSTTFCKFDAVDFYLSGEHGLIEREVVSFLGPGPEANFVGPALQVILSSQVVLPTLDEELASTTCFRVVRGSGMGLIHAGATADAVFAHKVETPLLREAVGLQGYCRFRDDIFAALESPAAARVFIDRITSLASCFCEVRLELASLATVTFLDMRILKGPAGTIVHRPHVKESARHIPLAPDSVHPKSVHSSWPVAEVARIRRRATELSTGKMWGQYKIDRFRHYLLEERVLEACRSELNRCIPLGAAAHGRATSDAVGPGKIARLVLPYNPRLKSLPAELVRFVGSRNQWLLDALGITLRPQISWSKAGPSLAQLVSVNRGRRSGRR